MSEYAIQVKNLGKEYFLNKKNLHYNTLSETLTKIIKEPFSILKERTTHKKKFWALQDISFNVKHGEILGIIGHNGAGKSTLLKILSRITEPTTGRAEVYGRVGSLLEVGTGFHWELTGRENIFLNGAIIGMKKAEIKNKFDEIVAFSEIEEFLDTPVKRYSSGMYIRLAFAVAAHLEPEILIIDEVLSVGDAQFQKKCLGKMKEVGQTGRTVLFVSHNLLAVEGFCKKVILLSKGRIEGEGEPRHVISQYLNSSTFSVLNRNWEKIEDAPGNELVRIHSVKIKPHDSDSSENINVHTSFRIEFEYWNLQTESELNLSIDLINEQGITLFSVGRSSSPNWLQGSVPAGLFKDTCLIPGNLLNDGRYGINLSFSRKEKLVYKFREIVFFDVHDSVEMRGNWYGKWPGVIRPLLQWETEFLNNSLK